ncbi:uncharacterized protein DEA37_0014945 [Paragonimus westermani]|uniref:Uncharacterized protein n=1 Tax=Paragonimus westermani TaxID=34504 RepID=A0A5J4NCD7_9TREM|nr:uncharacterized protein DEA37_0014945 [Paragonimus westermani]
MELEKVIPPLPRVVRGKPVVLGADPKGTYLLYASGNSVVLRNLKHHSTFVNVVRFCPTGTCFISTGSDGKIFIYDAENGSTVGELGNPAHKGGIYGACFSKDGSRFLSASADKSLKLWKVDGQQFTFLSQYEFENKPENMLPILARLLISVFQITDEEDEHQLPTLKSICSEWWQRQTARVTAIGWSPNGRRIATGSLDTSIAIWSLDTPKHAIVLCNAHPMSNSTSLSWMDDCNLTSTALDGSVRSWKVSTP